MLIRHISLTSPRNEIKPIYSDSGRLSLSYQHAFGEIGAVRFSSNPLTPISPSLHIGSTSNEYQTIAEVQDQQSRLIWATSKRLGKLTPSMHRILTFICLHAWAMIPILADLQIPSRICAHRTLCRTHSPLLNEDYTHQ